MNTPAAAAAWQTKRTREARDDAQRALYGGYTLAEVITVASDPWLSAKRHGRIPERVRKDPVPFVPSVLQRRMFLHYSGCQRREVPCREVVVKIRRGGGSTGASWLLYVHAHNYGNARLGAVGTDEEVSMNMFKMIRFFDKFDTFKGWVRSKKTLETGFIEWANDSTWEKYTAQNPEAARSAGLQGYHASEIGRWPDGGAMDARETLKSMLGAVPRRGFTVVIEESTATGAAGAFYDRFQGGRWPSAVELSTPAKAVVEGCEYWRVWEDETPQNIAASEAERALQFVRVFAAWFEDDENRPEAGVSGEDRARIEATLDAKELELVRRYKTIGPQGERLGWTATRSTIWEQLAWRRSVIASEFDGDVEGFQQENPSSPKEAFASSGRHSFNRAGCAYLAEQAKSKVPEIGVLFRQHDGQVLFKRTGPEEAWFHVWQMPREGYRYVIGLDTCGGKSNQKNPNEADYHAGIVMRAPCRDEDGRAHPPTVVASLLPRCQFDPDVLAEKMAMISDWFGGCLVVFEVNNTGAAFRQEAIALGMNLYREETTDKFTSQVTDFVGWTTTKETRPLLISALKKALRNNAVVATRSEGVACWNPAVAQECTDMILGADGKDQAPGGKHDDHVMALGMALHCIDGATLYRPKVRRRREPVDRGNWTRIGR